MCEKQNIEIAILVCSPSAAAFDQWAPVIHKLSREQKARILIVFPDYLAYAGFSNNEFLVSLARTCRATILYPYAGVMYRSKKSYKKRETNFYIGNRALEFLFFRFIRKFVPSIIRVKLQKHSFSFLIATMRLSGKKAVLLDIRELKKKSVRQIIKKFPKAKKFSMPHGINLANEFADNYSEISIFRLSDADSGLLNIFLFSGAENAKNRQLTGSRYNIFYIGVPRHSDSWNDYVRRHSQNASCSFSQARTVLLVSRPANERAYLTASMKRAALEAIKSIIIDKLGFQLVIKLHPTEAKEDVFFNCLGRFSYGDSWQFSKSHHLDLMHVTKMTICFYSSIAVDCAALNIPAVEYLHTADNVLLPSNLYYGHGPRLLASQYAQSGLIESVNTPAELEKLVKHILSSQGEYTRKAKIAYGAQFRDPNASTKLVHEVIIGNKFVE